MANLVPPLKAQCKECKALFLMKYNPTRAMYSQKNYWRYWVDPDWNHKEERKKREEKRGSKICDNCLADIYLNQKWRFLEEVKSESRKQTLRSYLYHGVIKLNEKAV